MEVLTEKNGMQLIKKYNRYYIRFHDEQIMDAPCEIQIKENEADEILEDSEKIHNTQMKYKENNYWTLECLMQKTIMDFLKYDCKMSNNRTEVTMSKFSRHKDIEREFYEYLMYGEFPHNSSIVIEGHTAEKLNRETYLSAIGAYNYLIYLRENPQEALMNLKKGLPGK